MAENDNSNDNSQQEADDIWPYAAPPGFKREVRTGPAPRYEEIWLDDTNGAETPFVAPEPAAIEPWTQESLSENKIQPNVYEEVWLNGPPPPDFPFGAASESEEFQFVPVAYTPETPAETVRQSGLAYSAGIVFFASVAFMLLLGWFADLLLGSTPWGIVGGVILGSAIGFVQFFRITSRIFPPNLPENRTILSRDDDAPQPPQF